ncbi:MAG: YdcF family protein, partial [Clostridiales bacterium]|nr:YdcF family protein [Clostridiales bacterium]
SEKGILRYIRHLGYLGVFAMLLICTVIFAIGRVNTTQFDEDAVIVLGGGFLDGEISPSAIRRLDRAAQYYDRNNDAIFVLSGGKTQWQPIAEGYVMRDYLLERGIPDEQILVEDSAMNTSENIAKSKEILDQTFSEDYTVCIITSDYHGYRAVALADGSGIIGAKRYLARTPDRLIPPAYLRELCAVIKFWIMR